MLLNWFITKTNLDTTPLRRRGHGRNFKETDVDIYSGDDSRMFYSLVF